MAASLPSFASVRQGLTVVALQRPRSPSLGGCGSTRSKTVTNHVTGETGVFELDATGQLHCLQCHVIWFTSV